MKKLLSIITLLLLCYVLSAQNTSDDKLRLDSKAVIPATSNYWSSCTNGIYYDGSLLPLPKSEKAVFNVGIGTSSPLQRLHVNGDSYLQGKVYIGNTDTYFYRDVANRIKTNDMFYVGTSSPATYLYSTNTYLGASSGDKIHLRGNILDWTSGGGGIINSNGNVGIGTTTPDFKLQIEHSTAGDGGWTSGINIKSTNTTTGEAALSFNNTATSSNHWIMGLNQNNRFRIAYGSSFTDSYTKFSITTDGKVGIGTTSPSKKLDVKGDINFTGNLYKNGTLVSTGGGGSSLWTQSGSNIYYNTGKVGIGTSAPKHTLHLYSTGSKIAFGDNNTFEQANSTGGLNCLVGEFGNTDTDILQLHGKKGISITTGNYQNGWYEEAIHIDSKHSDGATVVRVNGKLFAKEVEVALNVWSDFVFYDGYNLRTLNELESFIRKNKHLPDVPSADEVKKEGINLGEMDAILLQKIEELTLYIIDLKKENEELKELFNKSTSK